MEEILFLALLFVVGFVSGFVGNFISGGTSLIALSSMLSMGIPPYLAIATQHAGALGWRLGGLRHFAKANKIVWKLIIPLSIAGLVGEIIGANILISIDEALVGRLAGFVILLFIPLSLIKKDLGVKHVQVSNLKLWTGYVLYFLVSIWGGIIAAGIGIVFIYLYMWFFGLTALQAKGTSKIPGLFGNLAVLVVLFMNGIFNIAYVLAFVPGMFLGASLGAKKVIQFGDEKLRIVILITIAIMSLRLIFT